MEVPQNPRTSEELHDRRMLAAALFEAGQHSQAEIDRMLGVSRQAVHQWYQAWSKGGTNALHPGQQGADTLLAPEQECFVPGSLHTATLPCNQPLGLVPGNSRGRDDGEVSDSCGSALL